MKEAFKQTVWSKPDNQLCLIGQILLVKEAAVSVAINSDELTRIEWDTELQNKKKKQIIMSLTDLVQTGIEEFVKDIEWPKEKDLYLK